MWFDTCKLKGTRQSTNNTGKLIDANEYGEEIFCEEKSIGMREFYSAQTSNLKPEIQISIKQFDYNNESYILYKGIEYTVVRTFRKGNSDDIELYLARGIHDASS